MAIAWNVQDKEYSLFFTPHLLITNFFFVDNGPHYHNSRVFFYLTEVKGVFNFTLKEYNNFEVGEGTSQLDSHFAHISHKKTLLIEIFKEPPLIS